MSRFIVNRGIWSQVISDTEEGFWYYRWAICIVNGQLLQLSFGFSASQHTIYFLRIVVIGNTWEHCLPDGDRHQLVQAARWLPTATSLPFPLSSLIFHSFVAYSTRSFLLFSFLLIFSFVFLISHSPSRGTPFHCQEISRKAPWFLFLSSIWL